MDSGTRMAHVIRNERDPSRATRADRGGDLSRLREHGQERRLDDRRFGPGVPRQVRRNTRRPLLRAAADLLRACAFGQAELGRHHPLQVRYREVLEGGPVRGPGWPHPSLHVRMRKRGLGPQADCDRCLQAAPQARSRPCSRTRWRTRLEPPNSDHRIRGFSVTERARDYVAPLPDPPESVSARQPREEKGAAS